MKDEPDFRILIFPFDLKKSYDKKLLQDRLAQYDAP